MGNGDKEYKFAYLNGTLYILGIIVFAFIWWIAYLLLDFNISLSFMEGVHPFIWIQIYMVAGAAIPIFILRKPLSGVAVGKIKQDSVEITFKRSVFRANYKDINKINYTYFRGSAALHIEFSSFKKKVITQIRNNDESLHQFYIALNDMYKDDRLNNKSL